MYVLQTAHDRVITGRARGDDKTKRRKKKGSDEGGEDLNNSMALRRQTPRKGENV